MKQVLAAITAVLLAGAAFAGDGDKSSSPSRTEPVKHDICEYRNHDWSGMREVLVAISRFRGKNEAGIQEIARGALTGSKKFSIGEFELQYARGSQGAPPARTEVCFAKKVSFGAVSNDGVDSAYECEVAMDVGGKVRSISCTLVAG